MSTMVLKNFSQAIEDDVFLGGSEEIDKGKIKKLDYLPKETIDEINEFVGRNSLNLFSCVVAACVA